MKSGGGVRQRIGGLSQSRHARFLCSVGAQGAVSGFHFALNLVLLRLVTPYDYGVFAFAFVLAMFASAINNALIATPLTVWTPVIVDERQRRDSEALFGTLNVALTALLLLIGLLWTLAPGSNAAIDALGATCFVAAYAARQYSRTTGYARLRPLIPAAGDITYAVVGTLLIGARIWLHGATPIGGVLAMLALANICAMTVERLALHGALPRLRRVSLRAYAPIWRDTRWALLGSLTTLFLGQAHSVVVTSRLGPDAFAPLAAGFVLFGPIRIALLTWQNMVKPELAMDLAAGRNDAVRAQLRRITIVTTLAVLALGVLMAFAWPWIHAALYAERYAAAPMGFIVTLWAAITLFAASYNAPSAALQALKEFRRLAWASVSGAMLSGVLVVLLLRFGSAVDTLYGVLAAEAFLAIWLMRLLHRRLSAISDTSHPTSGNEAPAA